MFHADGTVRSAYRALHEAIAPTAAADLAVRSEALDRAYVDQGITFSLSGQERPFPLDLVPRVISASEWNKLARASCSGCGRWRRSWPTSTATRRSSATACCRAGSSPVASTSTGPRSRLNPPNGVRIHVAGIDLVRDEEGTFRVLEDNLRNPSGVSYVMENRRTMARVFPDLFTRQRVRAVGDYATHLLRALRRRPRPTRPTRPSSCSPRASTTRPTSSTRCWPGRWAWSWSRAGTCSAGTTWSTCAPPRASSGWT